MLEAVVAVVLDGAEVVPATASPVLAAEVLAALRHAHEAHGLYSAAAPLASPAILTVRLGLDGGREGLGRLACPTAPTHICEWLCGWKWQALSG